MSARPPSSKPAGFLPTLVAFVSLAWVYPSLAGPPAASCGPDRCAGSALFLPLRVQAFRGAASTPGDFDFYVLSLSWSPGFCEMPAGSNLHGQCDAGANLGFVVHGLWPQYEHGYPSDCGPAARFPSRLALQGAQGLIPMMDLPGTNGRNTAPAPGKVLPTISPMSGGHAIQSSFPRRLSPPRRNRPGRRSISRALSSPPTPGCGQACWA